jgi:hypothetical protein
MDKIERDHGSDPPAPVLTTKLGDGSTVLVVDDEVSEREALESLLGIHGWRSRSVACAPDICLTANDNIGRPGAESSSLTAKDVAKLRQYSRAVTTEETCDDAANRTGRPTAASA